MHQAHLGFHHHIVASTAAVRSCLAVAGDASVDQLGIDLPQSLIIHSIFSQAPGKIILNEDVALLCELVENLHSRLVLEG